MLFSFLEKMINTAKRSTQSKDVYHLVNISGNVTAVNISA